MNSDFNIKKVSFNDGLNQLISMFPTIDKEIITSVLMETDFKFESTIEILLELQGPTESEEQTSKTEEVKVDNIVKNESNEYTENKKDNIKNEEEAFSNIISTSTITDKNNKNTSIFNEYPFLFENFDKYTNLDRNDISNFKLNRLKPMLKNVELKKNELNTKCNMNKNCLLNRFNNWICKINNDN